MNIIRKNTTLNGTPTTTIKLALRTIIMGLKTILTLVERYERGEITEDECLDSAEEEIKRVDAKMNSPELKALEESKLIECKEVK